MSTDSPPLGDPFFWDTETLANEFSSGNRPWLPSNPIKFPPAHLLGAAIRDHGLEGSDILIYDSLNLDSDMLKDLGIAKASHKVAFRMAVRHLQKSSPAYQRWKLEKPLPSSLDFQHLSMSPSLETPPPRHDSSRSPDETHLDSLLTRSPPQPAQIRTTDTEDVSTVVDDPLGAILDRAGRENGADESSTAVAIDAGRPSEQVLRKRRKIAPVNISTAPLGTSSSRAIPSEADFLSFNILYAQNPEPVAARSDSPGPPQPSAGRKEPVLSLPWKASYLGPSGCSWQSILETGPDIAADPSRPFCFTGRQCPRGTNRRVNRAMKAVLGRNDDSIRVLVQTFDLPLAPDSSLLRLIPELLEVSTAGDSRFSESAMDVVLPLATGAFDDDVDPATKREMEEEVRDVRRELRGQLPHEVVDALLDGAIRDFAQEWHEQKRPKLEAKANTLWRRVRRERSLQRRVAAASSDIKKLETRLMKLRDEMQSQEWKMRQRNALLLQATCMEPTVHDIEYSRWLIDMLCGPLPPRPTRQALDALARTKEPSPPSDLASDEELLASEDDVVVDYTDDDDDYIMEDGIAQDSSEEPIDHQIKGDPFTPTIPTFPTFPATAARSGEFLGARDVIDLTMADTDTSSVADSPLPPRRLAEGTSTEKVTRVLKKYWQQVPEEVWRAMPAHYLADETDNIFRLLVALLWDHKQTERTQLLEVAKEHEQHILGFWNSYIMKDSDAPDSIAVVDKQSAVRFMSSNLFLCFIRRKKVEIEPQTLLNDLADIRRHQGKFDTFFSFLLIILAKLPTTFDIGDPEDFSDAEQLTEDVLHEDSDSEAEDAEVTPSRPQQRGQKRHRIIMDPEALAIRQFTELRAKQQEERRRQLHADLTLKGGIGSDRTRLIINDSKEDSDGFVYVNDFAAAAIQDHQIEGVRFLWNHIVANNGNRQGCLLAHTMGLGKSMQVITFLTAIAESAISPDPSVRKQIPKDLAEVRVLIICPPTLVENWSDELLLWDKGRKLGEVYKATSTNIPAVRAHSMTEWQRTGGVLIMGYQMFLSNLVDESLEDILLNGPNIVVADEAHIIKEPETKIRRACSRFRTQSRIALTGSPLSNRVIEYYSMVDWVAPNYMGPQKEFRQMYSDPIQFGLQENSTVSERRNSYKLLHVLRNTISPKVHRATIKDLTTEFPQKTEFVISIALTDLQASLYNEFVRMLLEEGDGSISTVKDGFSALTNLQAICSHPHCLKAKLKSIAKGGQLRRGADSGLLQMIKSVRDLNDVNLSWRTAHLIHILDQCKARGEKVLVFSHMMPTLDYLEAVCKLQRRNFARLDGKTPMGLRQKSVRDFNEGEQDIFLISTTAGGVGLNLFGASRVVIMDFSYNPTHEQQAIGRAFRIGQKRPVFVYYFIAAGSCQDELQKRSVFKRQLADRVVDQNNPKARGHFKGRHFTQPLKTVSRSDVGHVMGKDEVLDSVLRDQFLSQGVLNIIMTDTFEVEEDPENQTLTAEEAAEVRLQLQLEELRRKGLHNPPSLASATLAPRPIPDAAGVPSSSSYLQQPLALRASATAPTQATPLDAAWAAMPTAMPTAIPTATPIAIPTAMPPAMPTSAAVAPMTMTGSTTNFRESLGYLEPIMMSDNRIRETNRVVTTPTAQPVEVMLGKVKARMGQTLDQVDWSKFSSTQTERPRLTNATKEAIAFFSPIFNRNTQYWSTPGNLEDLLKALQNERFSMALALGYLRSRLQDNMKVFGIRDLLETLKRMSNTEFDTWLLTESANMSNKDPDHLNYALRRADDTTRVYGEPSSPITGSDLEELRRIADSRRRRKSKQQKRPHEHIPEWAANAVLSGSKSSRPSHEQTPGRN